MLRFLFSVPLLPLGPTSSFRFDWWTGVETKTELIYSEVDDYFFSSSGTYLISRRSDDCKTALGVLGPLGGWKSIYLTCICRGKWHRNNFIRAEVLPQLSGSSFVPPSPARWIAACMCACEVQLAASLKRWLCCTNLSHGLTRGTEWAEELVGREIRQNTSFQSDDRPDGIFPVDNWDHSEFEGRQKSTSQSCNVLLWLINRTKKVCYIPSDEQ